jgi:hypothetical protein
MCGLRDPDKLPAGYALDFSRCGGRGQAPVTCKLYSFDKSTFLCFSVVQLNYDCFLREFKKLPLKIYYRRI